MRVHDVRWTENGRHGTARDGRATEVSTSPPGERQALALRGDRDNRNLIRARRGADPTTATSHSGRYPSGEGVDDVTRNSARRLADILCHTLSREEMTS